MLQSLVVVQTNFQLHISTQTFYVVNMNSSLSVQKQITSLLHIANYSICN